MARISTYPIDNNINSQDKVIGSNNEGYITKNYTFNGIVAWLNATGAVAINGQNNYFFQSVPAETGRLQGTISFDNFGGVGTAFSLITEFKLAEQSLAGYTLEDYLPTLVGNRIVLPQLDNLNNFGIYTITSIERDLVETAFFNVVLEFIEGHGALELDKFYGMSLYNESSSVTIPTLDQVLNEGNTSLTEIVIGTDFGQGITLNQQYANIGFETVDEVYQTGISYNSYYSAIEDLINGKLFRAQLSAVDGMLLNTYGSTGYVQLKSDLVTTTVRTIQFPDKSGTIALTSDIPSLTGYVQTTRTISTTSPLQGGGDLSADRTLSILQSSASQNGYLSSTDWSAFNSKQNAITLTTTGSGAATFVGNTLNIPTPTIPTVNPSALTKTDDTNVTLTLGGTPSTALLQAVSLTLGWTGTLADSRIASATTWNAKQNAITLTTTGTGAATFISNTLNIPTPPAATFTSLTTTGSSGSSTLTAGVLNVPTYTLAGLGGVPTSRTLTINGTAYDLSADRSWTIPTSASPLTTKGDIYTYSTADARLPVGLDTQILIADSSTPTGLKWGSNTAPTPLGYYGAFQDNTTQTAVSANTAYPVKLNTTDLTNGVSVVNDGSGNPTRITLANTGIYNIQFSLQLEKTGGSGNFVVDIWIRKNGVDIPSTTGKIVLTGSANASPVVAAWNYVLDLTAGDYVQLMWATTNNNAVILAAAAASPHPSVPSAILTVTQQSGIMAGTGITAINSLTGAAQTLATGTSGTDFGISSTGTTHTFNLPTASAANRGVLSSADWSTFNSKQDALISGTNIKTINSNSILGSGNLDVQPTLVSGTNIKTINGTSILGGGDLNASGRIISDYAGTGVTGTTTNTIAKSYLIPANTFVTDDMFKLLCSVYKDTTIGNVTLRTYLNTSISLQGATALSNYVYSATTKYAVVERAFVCFSDLLLCWSPNSNGVTDRTNTTVAMATIPYTFTSDIYFIVAIQLANAADSASLAIVNVQK